MDSILLFPPGPSIAGSQLQVGTFLDWTAGADYGAKGLIQSQESTNALRDGGVFAFRNVGPRQMSFPLLLRDVPGQTLLQTETLMRRWATPGGAVAIQTETTPSGQAVFFDVLDGRWEPAYDGFENRIGRRRGTLFLDTQPWGYWPTEILLASSASIGYMGVLPVNGGASLIGDISPLARIQIVPTVPSTFAVGLGIGGGPVGVDMVGLSLGARPSFNPFITPAQFIGATMFVASSQNMTPTLTADAFAPASQAIVWSATNGMLAWTMAAISASTIPSALEPAYRGRFRAFAFLKQCNVPSSASQAPMFSILDAERAAMPTAFTALASSNQLASAVPVATSWSNFLARPSLAYEMLDMGELTLPPQASGVQGPLRLRLWLNGSTVPAATLSFGGVYLLPVDGAAGILTRGGWVPTLNGAVAGTGTQGGFEWNTAFRESVLVTNSVGLSAPGAFPQVAMDAAAFYRGVAPRLGASTSQLNFITGDRAANANAISGLVMQGNNEYSQVSVSYRPAFQFLYGI